MVGPDESIDGLDFPYDGDEALHDELGDVLDGKGDFDTAMRTFGLVAEAGGMGVVEVDREAVLRNTAVHVERERQRAKRAIEERKLRDEPPTGT